MLDKVAFGHPTLSFEDLLDDEGNFRLLQVVSPDDPDSEKVAIYAASQTMLMEKFKDLLRDKFKKDPSFISRFVHWCTGQSYIPDLDAQDFKIKVEFNFASNEIHAEGLPVAHTCDKLMKLPGTAYDGDIEKFEAKLAISMEQFSSFSMN